MTQPQRLVMRWSKTESDWIYDYPDHKWNAHLLHSFVSGDVKFVELVSELEKRGYDTTTLRLSVRRAGDKG